MALSLKRHFSAADLLYWRLLCLEDDIAIDHELDTGSIDVTVTIQSGLIAPIPPLVR